MRKTTQKQNRKSGLAGFVVMGGIVALFLALGFFGSGCGGDGTENDGGTPDGTTDDGGTDGTTPFNDLENILLVVPGVYIADDPRWPGEVIGIGLGTEPYDQPGCGAGQYIMTDITSVGACFQDLGTLTAWGTNCGGASGFCQDSLVHVYLCDCNTIGRDFGASVKAWCQSKGHAQTNCGPGGIRIDETKMTPTPFLQGTYTKQACSRDGGSGSCSDLPP